MVRDRSAIRLVSRDDEIRNQHIGKGEATGGTPQGGAAEAQRMQGHRHECENKGAESYEEQCDNSPNIQRVPFLSHSKGSYDPCKARECDGHFRDDEERAGFLHLNSVWPPH